MTKYRYVAAGLICCIVLVLAAAASAQDRGSTFVVQPVPGVLPDGLGMSASGCPQPDEPREVGTYQVRFLVRSTPDRPHVGVRPFEVFGVVAVNDIGRASTMFTPLSDKGPGLYQFWAVCEVNNQGVVVEVFNYEQVAIVLPLADTWPAPVPTATSVPVSTPVPTATPLPTAPPTARDGAAISFTG